MRPGRRSRELLADAQEPAGGRTPISDAGFALLAQVTTGAFTAGLTIYLIRALGPHGFGLFGLALSIGAIGVLLSDMGISASSGRFIAERRGRRPAMAEVLADGVALKLLITGAASLVLAVAAGALAHAYRQPELASPLRAIALSLLGESFFGLFMNAFMSAGRLNRTVGTTLVESATEATASIALVAVGAGAGGAVLGRAVGYLVGALTGLFVALQIFGRPSGPLVRRPWSGKRDILRYAAPLMLTESAYTLFTTVDILLIGALLSATDVSFFTAPTRLITLLSYVGGAVASAVAPRQARREPQDVLALRSSLRWLVIFQSLLIAPVIVWARPLVGLVLGADFKKAVAVLIALAPYIFLRGLSPLISLSVNYLGQARRRLPIVLCALGVNSLIDALLLPRIGVVAAGIGTSVAYLIYVPGHLRICRRELRIPLRPLALTLARSAAAAAVMAGLLIIGRALGASILVYLAAGILATAAFALTLLLTGEISLEEARSAARGAKRAGRFVGGAHRP